MANANLDFVIGVKGSLDKLHKDLDLARSKAGSVSSGFSKAGSTIGGVLGGIGKAAAVGIGATVAAVGAMSASLIGLAAAGEEAVVADNRIRAINKSMGLFGKETDNVSNKLMDYADKLASTTGIDDDIIKGSQAILLTFKEVAKSADQTGGLFDRATVAAQDLAAAGFGSAEGNAKQLGKALNDPIKGIAALTKSGVTFTEAEKEKIQTLVKSGQMSKAQEIVMKAVETQVGGTAIATAKASDQMKWAFGEVQETAGIAFQPLIKEMLPSFMTLMDGIKGIMSGDPLAMDKVKSGVSGLATSLAGGLGKILPVVVSALGTIITSVAAVIPQILPPLVDALVTALGSIAGILPTLLPAVMNGFLTLLTAVAGMLPTVIPVVIDTLMQLLGSISTMLPTILPLIIQGFITLLTSVSAMLPTLLPMLVNALVLIITQIANALPTVLPLLITAIIGCIPQLVVAIVSAIPALLGAVWQIFNAILAAVPTLVVQLLIAIGDLAVRLGSWLGSMFGKIAPGLGKFLSGMLNWWTSLPGKVINSVTGLIKDMLTFGGNVIQGFKDGINNAWNNMVKWFKGLFGDLIGIAKKILGIASPSKVFSDIGKNVSLGLAKGMMNGQSAVANAASVLADLTQGTYSANFSASATAFGGGSSYRPSNTSITNQIVIHANVSNDVDIEHLASELQRKITEEQRSAGLVFA